MSDFSRVVLGLAAPYGVPPRRGRWDPSLVLSPRVLEHWLATGTGLPMLVEHRPHQRVGTWSMFGHLPADYGDLDGGLLSAGTVDEGRAGDELLAKLRTMYDSPVVWPLSMTVDYLRSAGRVLYAVPTEISFVASAGFPAARLLGVGLDAVEIFETLTGATPAAPSRRW